jgi:alginate O-acetyltransferase complex protein AlgI
MLFNDTIFLLWFLPVVLLLYGCFPSKRTPILLAANYVFYGWWNVWFCLLMLTSTTVDYLAGKHIFQSQNNARRKMLLLCSLCINLSLLGFFKYFGLLSETINALASTEWLPSWNIVLPVGISFYTFQSMSYSIDMYRKKIEPANTFFDFACYVSLFPQLVAGPIIRYKELADQLVTRSHTYEKFAIGLQRFIIGLAKKIIIADTCSIIANEAFATSTPGTYLAWLGILAYTFQIYYDFSGYSDMAIGLGLLFGFTFPENFRYPYLSESIGDFWRRWHITLGNWFRDYVYIPLGGSKKGIKRTLINLLITMFLAGLWHGASWTFVLWGVYYGALLVIERLTTSLRSSIPKALQILMTFFLVTMGWVLFRSPSFDDALQYYSSLFSGNLGAIETFGITTVIVVGLITIIEPRYPNIFHKVSLKSAIACSLLFIASLIMIAGNESSPFLYFQF